MTTTDTTPTTPQVGDTLVAIDTNGWHGARIATRDTIARITPTGILVMTRGVRLVAGKFGSEGEYLARGADRYVANTWVPEGHRLVARAEFDAETGKRKSGVEKAYSAWANCKADPDRARDLAAAAVELADHLEAGL